MKALALLSILFASAVFADSPQIVLHNTAAHVLIGGSGSVIQSPFNSKKYLLTNWHVCNIAPPGARLISEPEAGEPIVGKVVYKNPKFDLCLIEVDQRRFAIPVGHTLNLGQRLFSHSWPKGKFISTEGLLQAEDIAMLDIAGSLRGEKCPTGFETRNNVLGYMVGCFYPYPTGMTTLYAAPGSSGSAVVNESGELVGVIQSSTGGGDDAGIIMISRIREFLKYASTRSHN